MSSPPNTRTTSIGSINKNPGLGRTKYGDTVSLPSGQVVSAYDAKYATYLKLFTGEMFKAYESACIAKGTVQNRTLRNGKAAQFIFTGRMTADYHIPGTPILGSGDPPVAEKTIVMDDLLVSSAFVYSWTRLWRITLCVAEILLRLVMLWLKHTTRRSSVRSLWLHVKLILSKPLLVLSPAVPSSRWVITMSTTLKHWWILLRSCCYSR